MLRPVSGIPTADPSPQRSRLSLPALAAATAIVVVAFLDGRYVAFLNSKPAFFARIDVLLLVAAAVVGALVLGFVARRAGRRWPALATRRPALVVGGLVAVGFVLGMATAGATGALHREPVVLEAVGKAAGLIENVDDFVSGGDAPATCRSVPDGTAVSSVTAEDLGTIDGLTLRGSLSLPTPSDAVPSEVFVDGADLPPDSMQPSWSGVTSLAEVAPDGRSGVLSFAALTLSVDPPPGSRPNGEPWPTTLSGTIRWTCAGDWLPSEEIRD